MKTKFNWGVFFSVLLIIACIWCAIYGLITSMCTASWAPLRWLTPAAMLVAGLCATESGNEDQRYCYFQKQEEEIKRHWQTIEYLTRQVDKLDDHVHKIDERLDS